MAFQVLIIGAGNMGSALVKGIQGSDLNDVNLTVHDIHPEKLKIDGVATLAELNGPLNFDVVVFCVKPQDLTLVVDKVKEDLSNKTCIISILAGITINDIENALGFKGSVIRAMPNIAAVVGEAATALSANDAVTEAQKELASNLFNAIGDSVYVKESLMDAVTGLSGSGPAYIYMVIEALTDGGVKMGIPRNLAQKLATQTVLGSGVLVKTTGLHPAILREQVTTPGGTTIHAIHELEERGMRAMLISAVETAANQSAKLRKK